jgi:hypothetical protein
MTKHIARGALALNFSAQERFVRFERQSKAWPH